MDIRDRGALKAAAAQALAQTNCSPRKLALLHTGVAAAVTAVITVLNLFLSRGIADTGGLSGLGVRAILTTVQSVLMLLDSLLLPFWQVGFWRTCLSILRGEDTDAGSLLAGFHRFGPVLRLKLLQGLLYMAVAWLALQIATVIFLLTPLSAPMLETLQALDMSAPDTIAAAALSDALMPAYLLALVIILLLAVPIFYRLRMADLTIVDDARIGALAAIRESGRKMRGNHLAVLKLDLSFWWFYALQLLSAAVGFGDVLLPLLGISLPISADGALVVCAVLQLGCQLFIAWLAQTQVQVTYAAAYDALQVQEAPKSKPQKLPWD